MTFFDVWHVIGTMLVNRKRHRAGDQEDSEQHTIGNASTETLQEAKMHLDSISEQIAEELETRQ